MKLSFSQTEMFPLSLVCQPCATRSEARTFAHIVWLVALPSIIRVRLRVCVARRVSRATCGWAFR